MTAKEEEFKDEIEKIEKILATARTCFDYCHYLYNTKTEEEAEYIKLSDDFKFIREILWRMAIIELVKFYSSSNSHKFRLELFIRKLKCDGYFGDMGIDPRKIASWESRINQNKETIDVLIDLRDKLYAHTDRNGISHPKDSIPFKDVDNLFILAEDIIKEIYLSVFDSEVDLDSPLVDTKNIKIIKVLAKEKQNLFEKIVAEYAAVINESSM